MAYNHGVAKAIFEAEWKKKAAEYRKHGMSEEKIASMSMTWAGKQRKNVISRQNLLFIPCSYLIISY